MNTVQNWLSTARKTIAQWLSPQQVSQLPIDLPGEDDMIGGNTIESILARMKNGDTPPVRVMHSPYKDSTQISVTASTTFRASDFGDDGFEGTFSKTGAKNKTAMLVESANDEIKTLFADGWLLKTVTPIRFPGVAAQGTARIYKAFKPTKAILTELVTATYGGDGLPDKTITEAVNDAADVVLTMAFCGADNCFPTAPVKNSGISGSVFAFSALGNGISWPTIMGGIDFTAGYAVERSVLSRAKEGLPAGYDPVPRFMSIDIRLNLLGPSLR